MRIIGVDPGYSGALAVFDTATRTAWVNDVPVLKTKINGKHHKQYQGQAMLKLLHTAAGKERKKSVMVVIEEQRIYGCEGRKSSFTLGLGYGRWLQAIEACKLPYVIVKVSDWKKGMRLNSDKEFSRLKAIELFPQLADQFKFKKHHGRAEALLLACYGQEFLITGNKYDQRKKIPINYLPIDLYEVKHTQVTDLCNTAIQR